MYKVAAQNAAGIGAFTGAITTPRPAADHMHPPITAALTAPTGVTATSDDAGELTLTWEGAENADSFVLIAVRVDTFAHTSMVISDGTARRGTFTGLASSVDYIGIVVALKGSGASLQTPHGSSDTQTVQ